MTYRSDSARIPYEDGTEIEDWLLVLNLHQTKLVTQTERGERERGEAMKGLKNEARVTPSLFAPKPSPDNPIKPTTNAATTTTRLMLTVKARGIKKSAMAASGTGVGSATSKLLAPDLPHQDRNVP